MDVSLAGVLTVGPPGTSNGFPGMESTIALISKTIDCQKFDGRVDDIVSQDDYSVISTRVTATRMLYARSETAMGLRLTTADGASIVPIDGLLLIEFPSDRPLTQLEVKGIGRLEYLFAGQT